MAKSVTVRQIDWAKLAKLDATERKRLITVIAEQAYEEQRNGIEGKDRNAAGNLALRCATELRNEEKHVTDDAVAHAEKVLADLKKEQAKQRGSRPERISVPGPATGSEPVH